MTNDCSVKNQKIFAIAAGAFYMTSVRISNLGGLVSYCSKKVRNFMCVVLSSIECLSLLAHVLSE